MRIRLILSFNYEIIVNQRKDNNGSGKRFVVMF